MENIVAAKREKRLGTVVGKSGMRRFEADVLKVEDEDIVVVHLSDMHVGKDHAFRLQSRKVVANEDKRSLVEVVAEDIRSLGLEGRVDGLVISGDVTCKGTHDEFMRAFEILRDMLDT